MEQIISATSRYQRHQGGFVSRQQECDDSTGEWSYESRKTFKTFEHSLFLVTDVIKKGLLKVMYWPTGDMIADFFTKTIQGGDFKKFRNLVQNDK